MGRTFQKYCGGGAKLPNDKRDPMYIFGFIKKFWGRSTIDMPLQKCTNLDLTQILCLFVLLFGL